MSSRMLLAILFAVALPLLAFPMAGVNAASESSLKINMTASPPQVTEQQVFTLTVLVSNMGKMNTTSLELCLVYPTTWTLTPESSTPNVLNSAKSGCLHVIPYTGPPLPSGHLPYRPYLNSTFTLSPLQSNVTEFVQFLVVVPPGASPGSYTLFALLNSTSGNAYGSLAMPIQSQASLPLGGVLVPVSLILLLLPGFVTILIILWINRALSTSWQTGLVAALFSLFFGVAEWMYFTQFPPTPTGISANRIFNLDPSTLPLTYYFWVGVWSLVIGFLAGGGVLLLIHGRNSISGWWQRSDIRLIVTLRRYAESKEPTWVDVLRKNLRDAVYLHGHGWHPQVRATLSSSLMGDGKQPNPSPAPVTIEEKASTIKIVTTDREAKDKGWLVEEAETTSSTTQTQAGEGAGAPPSGYKNVLIGLLEKFDEANPSDVSLVPQYSITWDTEGYLRIWKKLDGLIQKAPWWIRGWRKIRRKRTELSPETQGMETSVVQNAKMKEMEANAIDLEKMRAEIKEKVVAWLKELNKSRFSEDIERQIPWILSHGGTMERRPDQSNNVGAQEWIRGSIIQTLEIDGPMPHYIFELRTQSTTP